MLKSEIIPINKLTLSAKQRMLELMQNYYENVQPDTFEKDLEKKDLAIVLKDSQKICGFSTQLLTTHNVAGKNVNILFSGDTIIEKQYRNSLCLSVTWSRMMLSIVRKSPDIPLYWLLTSKGYKTYRYLPVFFKSYFPMAGKDLSSFEKKVLLTAVPSIVKTNDMVDLDKWVIKADETSQRLRTGAGDITESRRKNPDIAYFEKMNPGYANGDELICLVQFKENNLTPFLLKRL